MNITPHLGFGDLIILKMKQITHKFTISNININIDLVKTYSGDYNLKMQTIIMMIKLLFPETTILLTKGPNDWYIFDNYSINQTYLYNDINIPKIPIHYQNYIIFHTKLRYDGLIGEFNNEIIPELITFFKSFKSPKNIIILGERHIGQNVETLTHNTCSLYNILMFLSVNNKVIDLTYHELTDGNPNINNFHMDVELINNAMCNVTFGIGGPFAMCKAFSKKNVSLMPFYMVNPYKTQLDKFYACDNSLVENVDELNNRIIMLTL